MSDIESSTSNTTKVHTVSHSGGSTTVKVWGHSFNRGTGDKTKDLIINISLQVVCLVIGFVLLALGVLRFFPIVQYTFKGKAASGYDVINVVISIYVIIFGLMIMMFSLFFPKIISMYFGFFRVYWGRGAFFIFLSCLVLTNAIINAILGAILIIVGIVFVILSFIPVVPPARPIIDCITD